MSSAALRLRLEGSVPRSLQQAGDEGTVASEFDDIRFVSGAVPGSGAKAGGGGGRDLDGPAHPRPHQLQPPGHGAGDGGIGGGGHPQGHRLHLRRGDGDRTGQPVLLRAGGAGPPRRHRSQVHGAPPQHGAQSPRG